MHIILHNILHTYKHTVHVNCSFFSTKFWTVSEGMEEEETEKTGGWLIVRPLLFERDEGWFEWIGLVGWEVVVWNVEEHFLEGRRWTLAWRRRSSLRAKRRLHRSHTYGFSPVWVLWNGKEYFEMWKRKNTMKDRFYFLLTGSEYSDGLTGRRCADSFHKSRVDYLCAHAGGESVRRFGQISVHSVCIDTRTLD